MESYDDASTELMMMSNGDNIMLHLGNAFFETSEDTATDHCENEVERMQTELDTLENEEGEMSDEMKSLKSILYGRFGKSINLEA
jgi:prefoldin subunit 4